MNALGESLVSILAAIVGLAVVSVLVSKKSQTGAVLQSGFGGFSEAISAAEAPVTGQSFHAVFPSSFGSVDLANTYST